MNPKKAFRKFGDALMAAGDGAGLVVGLSWIGDSKGWRVVMSVTRDEQPTHALMLVPKDARALAVASVTIEVDRKGIVAMMKQHRAKFMSGAAELAAIRSAAALSAKPL